MNLTSLIETHLDLPRLSKDLDEIGHAARVWSVRMWTRANMATLWDAAKGFRPIAVDDFVPASVLPLVEVIHVGQNSLPAHTHFQKRFCRPRASSESAVLFGYNHQSLSGITGPGYFVARPSRDAGEVAIDYTMVPKDKPETWPAVPPRQTRLGPWVYGGMIDVMRGLSVHVSVGRATKNGRPSNNWFVLVRQDPPSPGDGGPRS
jgi:hypothetical protein